MTEYRRAMMSTSTHNEPIFNYKALIDTAILTVAVITVNHS